jgi:molybdopterin-containing oxidoreductase family iron-sulfur binding subunit
MTEDPNQPAVPSESRCVAAATSLGTVRIDPEDGALPGEAASGGDLETRRISRRRLIGFIALLGVGGGFGGRVLANAGAANATGRPTLARRRAKKQAPQWMMIFDLRSCDGCEDCVLACQQAHYLPAGTEWIKVYEMVGAGGQPYYLPKPCMMCEDPPCLSVCPVGATFRTDEGIVLVDQDVCIGCRMCMAACPYESRYFNAEPGPKAPPQPFPRSPEWPVPQVTGTVGKCVLCAARLPAGQLPACAKACSMGVIYIGDLTTDVAVNGQGKTVKISEFLGENDAVRLKEELGTNPRVYYIPGHGQQLEAAG